MRILAYCLYKPIKPRQHPKYTSSNVTLIVPTIDTGEDIKIALTSWLKCNPSQIIFVTVSEAFDELNSMAREFDSTGERIKVIKVKKGNKRNQMSILFNFLVAGVNQCNTPITIFVDDDVIWPETMIEWILAPFENRQVGGVGIIFLIKGTSQIVKPVGKYFTIWEILAAFRISMRNIEITSTTYIDGGVCCLSGSIIIFIKRNRCISNSNFT